MAIRQVIEHTETTIGGVPCTVAQVVSNPGKEGATITFHAVRGIHELKQVMKAFPEAMKRAGSVKVDWAGGESSAIARPTSGKIHGFAWRADWSDGCAVYLITGPEYRHKADVEVAVKDLRRHFEQKIKAVPDVLEVIRHTDRRAREES